MDGHQVSTRGATDESDPTVPHATLFSLEANLYDIGQYGCHRTISPVEDVHAPSRKERAEIVQSVTVTGCQEMEGSRLIPELHMSKRAS